jgi:hypothetical protein
MSGKSSLYFGFILTTVILLGFLPFNSFAQDTLTASEYKNSEALVNELILNYYSQLNNIGDSLNAEDRAAMINAAVSYFFNDEHVLVYSVIDFTHSSTLESEAKIFLDNIGLFNQNAKVTFSITEQEMSKPLYNKEGNYFFYKASVQHQVNVREGESLKTVDSDLDYYIRFDPQTEFCKIISVKKYSRKPSAFPEAVIVNDEIKKNINLYMKENRAANLSPELEASSIPKETPKQEVKMQEVRKLTSAEIISKRKRLLDSLAENLESRKIFRAVEYNLTLRKHEQSNNINKSIVYIKNSQFQYWGEYKIADNGDTLPKGNGIKLNSDSSIYSGEFNKYGRFESGRIIEYGADYKSIYVGEVKGYSVRTYGLIAEYSGSWYYGTFNCNGMNFRNGKCFETGHERYIDTLTNEITNINFESGKMTSGRLNTLKGNSYELIQTDSSFVTKYAFEKDSILGTSYMGFVLSSRVKSGQGKLKIGASSYIGEFKNDNFFSGDANENDSVKHFTFIGRFENYKRNYGTFVKKEGKKETVYEGYFDGDFFTVGTITVQDAITKQKLDDLKVRKGDASKPLF